MPSIDLTLPRLPPNGSTVLETALGQVMLCRAASGLHALRPVCPHQRLPLAGARIRGTVLTCPHHGARFSLEDGRSLSPLTPRPLDLLSCRLEGERVTVTA